MKAFALLFIVAIFSVNDNTLLGFVFNSLCFYYPLIVAYLAWGLYLYEIFSKQRQIAVIK
jgi:hypothetical protein